MKRIYQYLLFLFLFLIPINVLADNATYTIKYSCGTGTGTPPANQNVTYGKSMKIASNNERCKKEDQEFFGWIDQTNTLWKDGWNTDKWTYVNGQYGITNNTLTLTAYWGTKEHGTYKNAQKIIKEVMK